ncbi:hypothetical protein KUA11_17015, partial [Acetobacter estunensis]
PHCLPCTRRLNLNKMSRLLVVPMLQCFISAQLQEEWKKFNRLVLDSISNNAKASFDWMAANQKYVSRIITELRSG